MQMQEKSFKYCFHYLTFLRKKLSLSMALIKREILTSCKVLYTKFCTCNQFLFCKKDAFQKMDFSCIKCQLEQKKIDTAGLERFSKFQLTGGYCVMLILKAFILAETDSGEHLSRKKSLKESIRRSFRRLRSRKGSRSGATPTKEGEAPASPTQEAVATPVSRLVEESRVDESVLSMVRCLYFVDTYIKDGKLSLL